MARWGGFGNHRMSTLGFSGDVTTSWASLAFQPYFTSTASNVGFFWTHDIGGFEGQPDPELYTRWIQWGTLSNMLRTHCDGKKIGGGFTRDIWDYPASYFEIMQSAFQLRAAIVPYTYTQHAQAYSSGVGLLRPMYYHFPEDSNAYSMTGQYMFGEDILVSPITSASPGNNLTEQTVWIPEGNWIEYYSGKLFTGPTTITRNYSLAEIPAFVKAGAIIPMRSSIDAPTIGSAQEIPSILRLDVYPISNGVAQIYEDDGKTLAYETGSFAITQVESNVEDTSVYLTINAITGNSFPSMVSSRGYEINLINVWPATTVSFSTTEVPYSATGDDVTQNWWTYIGPTLTVKINIATPNPVDSDLSIKVGFVGSLNSTVLSSGFSRQLTYLQTCKDLLDDENGVYFVSDYPHILRAAGFGLGLTAENAVQELPNFAALYQAAQSDAQNLLQIQVTPEAEACIVLLNSA
eukprot:TRINITY_DN3361_c0_g1_i1.p1 TRINITY_DN3361_c0_g1~~TRINITY_DN3361_c0_g1_i1.p1  ORF type:complete len:463 (-),score=137.00 TRINITY_DN3361_c0_g1_i1:37-1425(-)